MSSINIESANLSVAWAGAFLQTLENEHSTLIVTILSLQDGIEEDKLLRQKLDEVLLANDKPRCHTVANTIFPVSLWNPKRDRQLLYERYENAWPRIRECMANRRGGGKGRADTYFRRLTRYDSTHEKNSAAPVNQLDFIAQTWNGGNQRRSALQASTFVPSLDESHSQRLGFPCMHHVSFTPLGSNGKDGLEVTGLYPTQTIFEKGYGNYLGLCRLGQFMAHEMGLELASVRCIALRTKLKNGRDVEKRYLRRELERPAERLVKAGTSLFSNTLTHNGVLEY